MSYHGLAFTAVSQAPTDAVLVVHIMHLIDSQSLLLIQLLLLHRWTRQENVVKSTQGVFFLCKPARRDFTPGKL